MVRVTTNTLVTLADQCFTIIKKKKVGGIYKNDQPSIVPVPVEI